MNKVSLNHPDHDVATDVDFQQPGPFLAPEHDPAPVQGIEAEASRMQRRKQCLCQLYESMQLSHIEIEQD